ncbi:MAG: transglycosylase domain-containing protein [Dehalococcoidia bacterium]
MARNFATRRLLRERRRRGGSRNGGGGIGWHHLLVALIGVGFIAAAVIGATGYGVYRSYASDLLPPDEMIARQPSGGAQIFDRQGNLLYEYVDDRSGLRSPVKLEDISPYLVAATISTEDWGYWDNPGVNYKGLARASLEYAHVLEPNSATNTGGSSITQQLVKNVYISQEERSERSVKRKVKETVYAIELTRDYSKDQILEWYLNQIPYGGLYNGVEAAAQGYFGKSAKDLTLDEAALLAGIPAGPSRYDPVNEPEAAQRRRNEVLKLMQGRNRVDVDVFGEKVAGTRFQVRDDGTSIDVNDISFYTATLTPLNISARRFPVKAPHWVFDYVEPQIEALYGREALTSGGLRVTTTLDMDLQQKAQVALEQWISEYEEVADGHNGALVALDPRTSEILVMVGSRDYFRDDIEGRNNNALSVNSPGSTLKPFTYITAMEELGWGTDTEVLDTAVSFPDGDKVFSPRNPDGSYHGPMTVRNALGNSMNVTAFKTALYVGVPNVVAAYKKFGMTSLDGGSYGPSVTIGGVDVKLLDVTYAYSVLAANGIMRGTPTTLGLEEGNRKLDPVSILQITRADGSVLYPETEDHRVKVQEERVVDAQYAYMINNILSDPSAFCITYGCGALSIGRPWGVKTGTSEPYENSRAIGETWTYGYTPDLVAGVWAGNSDNSPMHNILSTSISYRAVRDFMIAALEGKPASSFERPPGLSEVELCTPSLLKANEACGRKVKTLYPTATAPKKEDDWWRRVKVDIRDGLLATELTPPQFVQERYALVIPPEVQGFARTQAEEWARILNLGVAPDERSSGQAPVRIDRPRNNTRVRDVVEITGKADSEDFVAYRVEFGEGSPPLEWELILRSEEQQAEGGLALWNTDDLPDGTYTLRVVLEDKVRGELSTFVTVFIGAGGIRVSPTFTPVPTPEFDF